MTDHDLDAIYEYLSAIPCIDNTTSMPPAGAPNELRNQCTPPPISATALPNDAEKPEAGKALRSRQSR